MNEIEVTAAELAASLKSAHPPRLLDVREPEEFDLVHLEGAQLIPLGELRARLDELPDGEIVTYCHHGVRSLQAVRLLALGGRAAKSLKGGIDAWARLIDRTLPRY